MSFGHCNSGVKSCSSAASDQIKQLSPHTITQQEKPWLCRRRAATHGTYEKPDRPNKRAHRKGGRFAAVLVAKLLPYARQDSASFSPHALSGCPNPRPNGPRVCAHVHIKPYHSNLKPLKASLIGASHGQMGRLCCRLSCAPGSCLMPVLRRCSGGHWAPCKTLTRRRLLLFM